MICIACTCYTDHVGAKFAVYELVGLGSGSRKEFWRCLLKRNCNSIIDHETIQNYIKWT